MTVSVLIFFKEWSKSKSKILLFLVSISVQVELDCDVTRVGDLVFGGSDPLFCGCGDCRR